MDLPLTENSGIAQTTPSEHLLSLNDRLLALPALKGVA